MKAGGRKVSAAAKKAGGRKPKAEAKKAAELTARILDDVTRAIMGALRNQSETITLLRAELDRAGEQGGLDAVNALAGEVADILPGGLSKLFNNIEIHLFPPSIEFGKGENSVTVSPTAGGSVGPDGKASIGVQVDVNPRGEGEHYIGRLTGSVDVDSAGKATGASVGWQCRF